MVNATSAAPLRAAIEAELEGVSLRDLHRAYETLSARYREAAPRAPSRPLEDRERLAYLAVRMPATFAAASAVMGQAAGALGASVHGLLDLGSGAGAALWAAADACPALAEATLIDGDAGMLALGARLWRGHPRAAHLRIETRTERLDGPHPLPSSDLVTLSYVLGELDAKPAAALLERALQAARVAVIVVEPGTPRGYQSMLAARRDLIARGLHVVAPCPHEAACPLTGEDWCHFAARLERSRAHRQLKQADLAWEDEKYAFIVASRTPVVPARARILRRPVIEKGRVSMRLCTEQGIAAESVTRRNRAEWRAARHARWGDAWPPDESAGLP